MPQPTDHADDARRLRALFDGVTHFVGLLTPDGIVLEANRAALELVGARLEDVVGQPFRKTPWWPHDPDGGEGLREALHAAASGIASRFVAEYPRPDGSAVTLEVSLTPALDGDGRVAFVIPEGRDITERRAAERALRESEARLGGILGMAADAIISMDDEQRITLFNQGAEEIFGYRADEVLGQPLSMLLPGDRRGGHAGHVADFDASGETSRFMNRRGRVAGRRRNGEVFPAEATISRLDLGGRPIFTAVLRDVTEREQADAELARAREWMEAILTSAAEGIVGLDRGGIITFANPAASHLLGYSTDELVGREMHSLVHHTHADGRPYPHDECPTWASVHDGGVAQRDDEVYWRADGVALPVEYTSTPFYVGNRVEGAVVVFRDISERRRAEEALRAMSLTDELTGLHNRRGFLSLAPQALRQARRSGTECMLIFIDLDDFKPINDVHGHLAGDGALADVGRLLRGVFRESDLVARYGGDEFVVLSVGGGAETLDAQRARLAQHLAEHNARPGADFAISLSMGAAVFDPHRPVPLEQLIKAADEALYREKGARR